MNEPHQRIYYALSMWANYIETGDIMTSAEDCRQRGEQANALSIDQMKMVIELRELAAKAFQKKVQILP